MHLIDFVCLLDQYLYLFVTEQFDPVIDMFISHTLLQDHKL